MIIRSIINRNNNKNLFIRLFIIIFIILINSNNIINVNCNSIQFYHSPTNNNNNNNNNNNKNNINNNNNININNNNNNNNKFIQPTLRFSKNVETPGDSNILQLKCIGGTAMGSSEEVSYLTCRSSLADIYSRDVVWKCQPNSISKNVQLHKLRIQCPKPTNYDSINNFDHLMTNLGNNHPCSVEYHLDWTQYSFGKVIGWSILGLIFFYIILNRNNNLYNAQINNPMSLPREQINPKVFRALGIIVCVIVFLSTLAFLILCLYMFSAPI